ncbi:MAG: sulfite oxidase [Alphaproteobacteria bacterium]|nr:sulfite oxidase [Alphaproteobacteria bacterium]
MRTSHERGLFELYNDDHERADAVIFGRRTGASRRGFLRGAGLTAMMAALGTVIPFGRFMPGGLIPVALAQTAPKLLKMDGKADGLVILGDRPLVAETPEHMLDDDVTPNNKFFIRNNGQIPDAPADGNAWELTIDGEVNAPLKLKVGELMQRFPAVTLRLQLECGGNGRSFFQPTARGNQWTNGGVGCAEWTGVRLGDVLKAAGVEPGAVYTGHFSADPHLSGDNTKQAISRGLPIAKAIDGHTLLAYRMNGQPLPNIHGFPLRIVAPGYPGSASQKWLNRVWVRNEVHDGAGMGGTSYRLPKTPIVPGADLKEADTNIMESMPLRAIITSPATNTRLTAGTRRLDLRGHAWAGERAVRAVDVSIDFGQTWSKAEVKAPANKYAWQRWTATVALPSKGYYEVWARGTDDAGTQQPFQAAGWNPQGYGSNPMHRIAVLVES